MFVDALLILTADCTSIRTDLQFDRDFYFIFIFCTELSLQYCPDSFLLLLLFWLDVCFVSCFVVVLFVFCLFSCMFLFVELWGGLCVVGGEGHCVVGGEGTV